MRKLTARLLVTGIAAGVLALSSFAATFEKTRVYAGEFTDVAQNEWYAAEVANTYELGLMNGIGGGLFDPDGKVTVAEAVTMAARAGAIHADAKIPAADGEWYIQYVNYALAAGIIQPGQFDSFDRAATRAEVAGIFEKALPADRFAEKNAVEAVNDVAPSNPYAQSILRLYKAGVVMGSDSYGNFRPYDDITRAEAAAIINRVALPENRLARVLDKYSYDDAYQLVYNSGYAGSKEGISSGWVLDNRGGAPRTTLGGGYGSLSDISKVAGTAMIREINDTTTGLIRLQTRYSISKSSSDGAYVQFSDAAGAPVWRVETKDEAWHYVNADGSMTKIHDFGGTYTFTFTVYLDIDNARSTIYINRADCGTFPLLAASPDVKSFRYGTTDESTAVVSSTMCDIAANYAVIDDFDADLGEEPFGWVTSNVTARGNMNLAAGAAASRSFVPVAGKAVAETMFLLADGSERVGFDLCSGEKSLVYFTNDETAFYANGVKVYDGYVRNLWYRLRLETDLIAGEAAIRLNGRVIATVKLASSAGAADNLVITNAGGGTASFDFVKVFRLIDHDDYVPVPVVPKGEEKYNVGMNICSLWRNGTHFGWACITPFDDIEPVLGYYDEGNPETADWEIKYMVEHGIDYQAFCWYPGETSTPIKSPRNGFQLYDGYFNAKYSDYMRYCILWEVANASMPNGMDAWKEHYVPYMIEYFFKDPRYMTIDNRPLLYVFGSGNLANAPSASKGGFGSAAAVKEAFDYLNEELAKIGLGKVIVIASHTASNASLKAMGFEGAAAYNWGSDGYSLAVNKSRNKTNAKDKNVFTIPTVSVGFNNVGWAQTRHPMMTAADFKAAHLWARDEFSPANALEGSWQENLFMISTWNEYGEGTFIMPTTDEKGFGYLDALREVYTDEKADPALDLVPTAEQKRRINRLYPQDKHLLRKKGYYTEEVVYDEAEYEVVAAFDLAEYDMSGIGGSKHTGMKQDENGISGVTNVADPLTIFSKFGPIDLNEVECVRITAKVPLGRSIETFFTTTTSTNWEQAKGAAVHTVSDDMAVYYVDMSNNAKWTGTLQYYRIDPGQGPDVPFVLKKVEFLKRVVKPESSKTVSINNQEFEMNLPPQVSENGEYLIAFDPSAPVALDYRLHVFHEWDKDAGVLTLHTVSHDAVYTVGKAEYLLDGVTKRLPYAVTSLDGLPLLPVKRFCEDVGYTFAMGEAHAEIKTDEFDFFKAAEDRVPLQWEFNTAGDTEGWGSSNMSLLVADGYLTATNVTNTTDPIISRSSAITPFPAEKYTRIEYRVRYDYESKNNQPLVMYFATDRETNLNEAKTLKIALKGKSSGAEWEEYSMDLADQPLWRDNITTLRFDPFNAVGTIDVDYIRFIADPDYEDKPAAPKPFEIRNGDAEAATPGFSSHNGAISIAVDPDNKDNKVYKVVSKNGAKAWLYAEQPVSFTPGKTYKIDYDVRIAAVGMETEDLEDKEYAVMCNFKYLDGDGKTDHIVSALKIKPSDGWQHYSATYTVNANSVDRSADQFTIYSNPDGDAPVGYYFDNVAVVPVEE